jgi:hypothetical protein
VTFKLAGFCAGFFVLFASECFALSEEEYLKYIDAEASKLSEPTQPVVQKPSVSDVKDGAKLSVVEFESLLQKKQKGTFSFYKSLIERDKAEVYKAYSSGASMQQIRRMIINRKMHR